jgi:hypothetical protein
LGEEGVGSAVRLRSLRPTRGAFIRRSSRVIFAISTAVLLVPILQAASSSSPTSSPSSANDGSAFEILDGLESRYLTQEYRKRSPAIDLTALELANNTKLADAQLRLIPGTPVLVSSNKSEVQAAVVAGEWLLLRSSWINAEVPDLVTMGSGHKTVDVSGDTYLAARVSGGKVVLASFDPDRGGQFGRGSPASISLSERPMFIQVPERPRSTDAYPGRRLVINLTDSDSSGQEVLISKSWLATFGMKRIRVEMDDGTPVPVRENGTHFLLGCPHFSSTLIYDDFSSGGYAYVELGGTGFTSAATGGIDTYRPHTSPQAGYLKFLLGPSSTDSGTGYLQRTQVNISGTKVNGLTTWYQSVNCSHDGTSGEKMIAGIRLNLTLPADQYATYSYVLVCWKDSGVCSQSDLTSREKLVTTNPTLGEYQEWTGHPNIDWNIAWGSVSNVKIEYFMNGTKASGDSFHMVFDDLVIGLDYSGTTFTWSGALYAGQESERFKFNVSTKVTRVEAELWLPSGADFDLSLYDGLSKRTAGRTEVNATSDTSIPGSKYGGTSASPEWIGTGTTNKGYWGALAFPASGEGLYTLRVTMYVNEALGVGAQSEKHKFQLSSKTYSVASKLRIPYNHDFDLSLWETSTLRTGGYASGDANVKNQTPNSIYSGRTANPETVSVAGLRTFGDWFVSAYSYSLSGTGGYALEVDIAPDSDEDGLSDVYEYTKVYRLYFGPGGDDPVDVAIPKSPTYANQTYQSRGYGHFMGVMAAIEVKRNATGWVPSLTADVSYWINQTSGWNFTSNTSGWNPVDGTWDRYSSGGEWWYRQSSNSSQNTNSYANVTQVGKSEYSYKCKFVYGSWPSCGFHLFADSTVSYQRGNNYMIWQYPNGMVIYKSINSAMFQMHNNTVLTTGLGQTHTYRVLYNADNRTILVYRDGAASWSMKWTDPYSPRIDEGKYISLRTDQAHDYFDNISATVEGWRSRSLSVPTQTGTRFYQYDLVAAGFEKERFMESNAWRVRIAKNNTNQWANLTQFYGQVNVTTDISNPDSDSDGLADGAEQGAFYVLGATKTITFTVPVTGKYYLQGSVATASGTPSLIEWWLDYDTPSRKLIWSKLVSAGATTGVAGAPAEITRG